MILVFANNISQLRDTEKLFQCHLAAAWDMDTPMFRKLSERNAGPNKNRLYLFLNFLKKIKRN
jgi:hypothetical protein